MTLEEIFNDKSTKPKETIEILCKWVLDGTLPVDELMAFAEKGKDPVKGSCIEALEFATKQNLSIANEEMLSFVTKTLTEKAPRIKWESAKVVGNIAQSFPAQLDTAIIHLLENTNHEGTVVRWSAAFALGEILKLKTKYNVSLLPKVETICEKEEKNSIRKIYLDAIKKMNK